MRVTRDDERMPWVRAAARLEHRSWLDGPARVALRLAGAVLPRGRADDALRGTWLGHPLHPLLVTATAGTWTGAVLMDLMGRREPARTLYGVGTLFGVPTTVTGLADWHRVGSEPQATRVGLVHAVASSTAVACFGASWAARHRGSTWRGRRWAAAGVVAVFAGDYLGGHLVYSQSVGVDRTAQGHEALRSADTAGGADTALSGEATTRGLRRVPRVGDA